MAKQSRYLLISPDYPPPLVGGGLVWVYNLIQHCPDSFDVLTASLPQGQAEISDSRAHLIRKKQIANSQNPPRLKLALSYLYMIGWFFVRTRRVRYDGIVVNMCVFGNSLFILIGRLLHLKIIGVVFAEELTTSLYCSTFKDRIHSFLLKKIYRQATSFFSVCDFSKRLLISCGIPAEKIDVIPPCIDLTRVTAHRNNRSPSYHILSVGRLIERKGFHDLIDVIAQLKREFFQIHLTIVGDGPMRPLLEEKIRKLRLEDSVNLVGQISDQQLAVFYQESDLFVLAHRMLPNGDTEGCPTVFCEASGLGLPVIGGTGGGADTVIEDGKTGFIVDAYRIEELADRIRRILTDPKLAASMGQAGLEKIRREHLPERVGFALGQTLQRFTRSHIPVDIPNTV